MLDKLFCKHEFVFVDREYINHFPGSDEYLFKFMCKKCKRKKFVSSLKIEKVYNKFAHKLNEMVVINGINDSSATRFVLPIRFGSFHVDMLMKAYAADKTIEYFKSRYFIDITQIENYSKQKEVKGWKK